MVKADAGFDRAAEFQSKLNPFRARVAGDEVPERVPQFPTAQRAEVLRAGNYSLRRGQGVKQVMGENALVGHRITITRLKDKKVAKIRNEGYWV